MADISLKKSDECRICREYLSLSEGPICDTCLPEFDTRCGDRLTEARMFYIL
ncbi:MAG: hypothetical protein ACYCX4_12265 [Bacillota bacterium]